MGVCPFCFEAEEKAIASVRAKGFAACLAEEVRRKGGWRREWMGETEGVA